MTKTRTDNEAVSRNCGFITQKRQYKFESLYPARNSVIAATAGEAANTLGASDRLFCSSKCLKFNKLSQL